MPTSHYLIVIIHSGICHQEPTRSSKQPIRTRYLGHVTGFQPIREQYFTSFWLPTTPHWRFISPDLSVVLINHGGTVVMHYIGNSEKSIMDDVSPIGETPGGKVR